MSKLVRRNQRMSGLLTLIVGVLMIAGPVLADSGNGNGSEKKDDSLPAVAAAASEGKGNAGGNGNGSEKKDEAPGASAAAPGNSGDKGNAGGNGNGADNGKGNDKKDEAPAAESNGNGSSNGNGNSSAGGSASEDKGNGWESAPGQDGKGCDQKGQGSGPYASTCDGSPSQNGNGNGGGGGKPCAGCVGNADNKNPPGQLPNGKDPNNGYECDGNKGIGKGNPAHTGCTPGNTPPPECKGKKCNPGKPDCPGNSCGGGKPDCPGNSCNPCPGNSCGGGEEPEGPCDADPTMPGTQPCNNPEGPCDKDPNMPGTQPCTNGPDPQNPDVIDRPGRPGKPQTPVVLGDRLTRPGPTVAARQPGTPLGSLLPFTGANLLIFLGMGLSLSGAGIMLNGKRK
ncbi:MAG: hypothetical protein M3279_05195 [Actinomycetota bacterium]|nr:hypothetical protein [Actinomycetota bacterium]